MKTGPDSRRNSPINVIRRRKSSQDIFDGTLQKTQLWLNEIMSELDWHDRPNKAYLALRTVLHALRDRLTVEEAVDLGAQLPMLIRGLYYEGWTLKGKPHKERKKADFLEHVKDTFENDYTSRPESITRAVFKTLARHTSKGEIADIKNMLPKPLHELWPAR
jgi:uncharacterized protein (DUF2267 family)